LNVLSERQICFHFIIFPSSFLLSYADQARGKVGDQLVRPNRAIRSRRITRACLCRVS
jgi:hypothetical protein